MEYRASENVTLMSPELTFTGILQILSLGDTTVDLFDFYSL